ncbi:GNAT family N-acetyltransferase [Filifactor villosus]|uniref:GNAT family N-acetyltransferase n=1 Tax=Filifactor villosus TaxID=29374 RepID=A0ABV9QKB9_9FIRM
MKVELKTWSEEQREDLIKVCNEVDRSYLSGLLPLPYTQEDASWWLNFVQEHEGREGVFRAVEVDGRVVGNMSVEKKEDVYHCDGEIGYLLLDEYASKGVMTQAVGLLCDLAFRELDILRITALVYSPNIASIRVLEKNGFIREGIKRNGVIKDGKVYDLYIYGLLRP